ncbi:MAG: hypothetical protein MMC33_006754 [Icmadophila ericetorum]|nr:hypothetical protein [Icmadophila ericetorum]
MGSELMSDWVMDPLPWPQEMTTNASPDRELPKSWYIPLGSITVPPQRPDSEWAKSEWSESDADDVSEAEYCPILEPLVKLQRYQWIRLELGRHQASQTYLMVFRIYVLPFDVGRKDIPRDDMKLRKALFSLIASIDRSRAAWDGFGSCAGKLVLYESESPENDSLFYIFNTLSTPSPSPTLVMNMYARDAVDSILQSPPALPGLKTKLYSYQQVSAATMIQREAQPVRTLDPRLEKFVGPTEVDFYLDQEASSLLKDKREYDDARGGILAETMGFGKTLICLTVILSTKGHWPQIPPEYSTGLHPVRSKVASLAQMAASTIGRKQIPWKTQFEAFRRIGEDYESCIRALEDNVGYYNIPVQSAGRVRRGTREEAEYTKISLCTSTLIIVPANLVGQWQNEIALHLEDGSLSLLVIDGYDQEIPPATELAKYDIILMSQSRFEREQKVIALAEPCPLLELHFLRLIVDEGHNFASSGMRTNAMHVLEKMHVERRWIVSGTPSNGLLGAEIGIAANETSLDGPLENLVAFEKTLAANDRTEDVLAMERRDLDHLGNIVTSFLGLQPWANQRIGEDHASWSRYVIPSRDGRRKARSLRKILESLVVRHRFEDLQRVIELPPLHNRVVHLQPCFFDKLSINLFLCSLVANAITSERTDEDYMFHPRNRHQLDRLVTNLRQSGFYWTGFTSEDVIETNRVSTGYLGKEDSTKEVSDRALLERAIEIGKTTLSSQDWKALSELNEIGIYVENFPEQACVTWALNHGESFDPLMVGATQLVQAQDYINKHMYQSDPTNGLDHAGEEAMKKAWSNAQRRTAIKDEKASPRKGVKEDRRATKAIPRSSLSDAPAVKVKRKAEDLSGLENISGPSSGLPHNSPLLNTRIKGTVSAKLSYLMNRVAELHRDEKILIFYEGDHIAYYIAQALELIGIQHLIYANGLTAKRRGLYIQTFTTKETFRVMLMDLRQAARGLHVACASRVFFVNPVWQPGIEAQAIKRAHRIGQARPVYVETLVLEGTFEHKMLQRRKAMTSHEHQVAQKSLLDDSTMSDIIKNATFIPISQEELTNRHTQMASLRVPEQLFGRIVDNPDADLIDAKEQTNSNVPAGRKSAMKGKARVIFDGASTTDSPAPKKRKSGSLKFERASGITRAKPKKKAVGFADSEEPSASPRSRSALASLAFPSTLEPKDKTDMSAESATAAEKPCIFMEGSEMEGVIIEHMSETQFNPRKTVDFSANDDQVEASGSLSSADSAVLALSNQPEQKAKGKKKVGFVASDDPAEASSTSSSSSTIVLASSREPESEARAKPMKKVGFTETVNGEFSGGSGSAPVGGASTKPTKGPRRKKIPAVAGSSAGAAAAAPGGQVVFQWTETVTPETEGIGAANVSK